MTQEKQWEEKIEIGCNELGLNSESLIFYIKEIIKKEREMLIEELRKELNIIIDDGVSDISISLQFDRLLKSKL